MIMKWTETKNELPPAKEMILFHSISDNFELMGVYMPNSNKFISESVHYLADDVPYWVKITNPMPQIKKETHKSPAKIKYIVVCCITNRDFGIEYKTKAAFDGVMEAIHFQNELMDKNPQIYCMIRVEYAMERLAND